MAWLADLPAGVLYVALTVLAAAENVFPPLPTDTVVAFGTWLAVRGNGSALLAFAGTCVGNVAGAAGMYALGRRHGTRWIRRRFPSLADERGEARLRALYLRYGLLALVVSRCIPGVRALVPPFAGALQVPMLTTLSAMALASAVWYGAIAFVAYRAGADWDAVVRLIAQSGRVIGVAAVVLALAAALLWWRHRRHARTIEG